MGINVSDTKLQHYYRSTPNDPNVSTFLPIAEPTQAKAPCTSDKLNSLRAEISELVASKRYPFKNIFDFTTAGDWDCVAAVERLPALHYSVDFIF